MLILITSSIIAITLPILVFTIAWFTTIRSITNREKSSPFECGFDPNHNARVPFSIRFFLLAIIFIVFDIEIVLLIPLPILSSYTNITILLFNSILFLIILIIGLIHEWNEGSLNWAN